MSTKPNPSFYAMPETAFVTDLETSFMFVAMTECKQEFDIWAAYMQQANAWFQLYDRPFQKIEVNIPGLALYCSKRQDGDYKFYLLHEATDIPVKHGYHKSAKRLAQDISDKLGPFKWDVDIRDIIPNIKQYNAVRSVYCL